MVDEAKKGERVRVGSKFFFRNVSEVVFRNCLFCASIGMDDEALVGMNVLRSHQYIIDIDIDGPTSCGEVTSLRAVAVECYSTLVDSS